ncbi:hypothetical protein [Desertivirga brevis]|uniref:hypothetical protein n=1 Tax=Desertivirga brevis TaxID=2810310 RepID=UPI001A977C9F|nr:hypothetical protein [Pedobacter sp. SYSU D00873]
MEKIPTIFDRNWETDRKVNEKLVVEHFDFNNAIATEKLDGTNVRVTVRNHTVVRVEKRRNPDKIQKAKGIVDPWYVDADERDRADAYIFEAVKNTDFSGVPDGEWSAEALGEKIQGNSLNLIGHTLFIFSLPEWREKVKYENVPTEFEALKKWLPEQKTKFGNGTGIEGIVWHHVHTGEMCKIKLKDFEGDGRK